ncbi:MAG: hypothetical protein JXA41_11010 [Deltaproteobacteria bacterium]|nr:hypothetical protein [Deltaproteobacteria bacterium]
MNASTRVKRRNRKPPASKSLKSSPAFKVLFSPKGGISKELSRLTQAAAKEINVAAYAFSSKYLGKALVSAMKRGIKVRVILDFDIARKSYSIDEWLIENGIDVRFIKLKRGCLHHKFMIIDGSRLISGSYNYTNDSEFRNYEAAIFIDATPNTFPCTASSAVDLIAAFAAEFECLWSLAEPR